mgnify:CR=1 FL=1
MAYEYSYLILGLVFFVIWLFLFLFRKDTRKEMLIMSILFGIAGILTFNKLQFGIPLSKINSINFFTYGLQASKSAFQEKSSKENPIELICRRKFSILFQVDSCG